MSLKQYWNKHLGISWRHSGTENSGSWEDPEAHSSKENISPTVVFSNQLYHDVLAEFCRYFNAAQPKPFNFRGNVPSLTSSTAEGRAGTLCVGKEKCLCHFVWILQGYDCIATDWTWSWGQKNSPSLLWLNCIRRHSSCNSTPFGSAQRDLSKLKWTAMWGPRSTSLALAIYQISFNFLDCEFEQILPVLAQKWHRTNRVYIV